MALITFPYIHFQNLVEPGKVTCKMQISITNASSFNYSMYGVIELEQLSQTYLRNQ